MQITAPLLSYTRWNHWIL